MAKAQQFRLTINSELSNLSTVADFVTEAARAGGLSAKQTDDVQMAVDEAVTNVIEHTYEGRTDGQVIITVERQKSEFVVEIQDFGKPFDASKVRTPRTQGPLSRRTVGGLGVFFMKKLMDRVEFLNEGAMGNRVRMAKRIK